MIHSKKEKKTAKGSDFSHVLPSEDRKEKRKRGLESVDPRTR